MVKEDSKQSRGNDFPLHPNDRDAYEVYYMKLIEENQQELAGCLLM